VKVSFARNTLMDSWTVSWFRQYVLDMYISWWKELQWKAGIAEYLVTTMFLDWYCCFWWLYMVQYSPHCCNDIVRAL